MINKKISTIAGSLVIIAIAIALGFSFLASNKKEEMQNQNNVVSNNSELGDKKEVKQESVQKENEGTQNKKNEIINKQEEKLGEEKDDHSCLISEGYFWCEEKQNCVQDWSKICNSIDTLDISKWENFNSQDSELKLKFSFKYPKDWFNQGEISGGFGSDIPFFSKNNYSRECHKNIEGGGIGCKQTGHILLVRILLSNTIPREINYENKQQKTIKINNYNGYIFEGIIDDDLGGYVANKGQKEIGVAFSNINFSNIKNAKFEIFMKIENDSDKEIFNKIISTLKFD